MAERSKAKSSKSAGVQEKIDAKMKKIESLEAQIAALLAQKESLEEQMKAAGEQELVNIVKSYGYSIADLASLSDDLRLIQILHSTYNLTNDEILNLFRNDGGNIDEIDYNPEEIV